MGVRMGKYIYRRRREEESAKKNPRGIPIRSDPINNRDQSQKEEYDESDGVSGVQG